MRSDGYHQDDLLSVHFKCPGRPGLTRKRCVLAAGDTGYWECRVMIVIIMIIAAGDAGDA